MATTNTNTTMTTNRFDPSFFVITAAPFVALGSLWMKKKLDWKKKADKELTITLPDWAIEYCKSLQDVEFTSEDEMMKIAVEMSRRNVAENTGGPFGTAIFEYNVHTQKSKLFSVGCNRVVPMGNSTLHGEMVAIQFAQQKLKTFSLHHSKDKEYHLYTSCEPCAMCLGGTLWSGVSKMVCSATKSDAEAIGFNEGPVFPESYQALEAAGCRVVRNVLREEGAEVLRNYGETGVIYNGKA